MTALKPRTASVVIYQGDDLEQIADLHRAAEHAASRTEGSPNRLGDVDESQAAKDAHDAFIEEAADRAVVVHLKMLGRRRFRDLMAEHPPVKGNDDDEGFEVHVGTFADKFLPLSFVLVDGPEPVADVVGFLDELSDGDFDRLFATAYWLNRAPGSDPKELIYSAARRSSDAT